MSTFLNIEHAIDFQYDDYISESWVELRMEPLTTASQTVHSFYLAVGPATKVFRYEDWQGNAVRHFSIAEYHREIQVRARTVVETRPAATPLPKVGENRPDRSQLGPVLDFLSFGGPITDSKQLRDLYELGRFQGESLGRRVEQIGRFVHETFTYVPNLTSYDSTIDDALAHRAGVCQDLAQIMIGLLRYDGIPARYVNGYVHVSRDDATASESHAWVEFYSNEFGWIGYDPTHGVEPGERHVVVATGRHYDEVPPNRGIYRGAASEKLSAAVRTSEIEAPALATFREELRDIELPIYSEIPDRHVLGVPEDQVDQTSQQQQQ